MPLIAGSTVHSRRSGALKQDLLLCSMLAEGQVVQNWHSMSWDSARM